MMHALALITRIALALGLVFPLAASAAGPGAGARKAVYVVISHPGRSEVSVDRHFLARAFLKKTTTWDDGQTIHAVDQTSDSPVRRAFSEEIIGRSIMAVRSYWQQLIFTGRGVPPPELDSDEAVVRFVLRHPGALGYVSGAADVRNARVLQIQ